MLPVLIGLGLLFLMSAKKNGAAVRQPPLKVTLPEDPAEAAAVEREARGDTPSSSTSANTTAEHDGSGDAAVVPPPRTPPPPLDVENYTVSPRPGADVARKSAQATADHVRNKGTKYDRARLAVWQSAAGIASDGLYGPGTVAALKKYGAKNVVKPLFKGGTK